MSPETAARTTLSPGEKEEFNALGASFGASDIFRSPDGKQLMEDKGDSTPEPISDHPQPEQKPNN